MKKVKLTVFLVLAFNLFIYSQQEQSTEDEPEEKQVAGQQDEFKPSGKMLVTIYSDFYMVSSSIEHINIKDGSIQINDEKASKGFEVSRAYFGYEYNISEKFNSKILFDVANPVTGSSLNMTAFLKYAYLQYKSGNWNVKFGMISTNSFGLIDKTWGHRYIDKSFQDRYKMGAGADLGFSTDYKINNMLSVDFGMYNGEGYKLVQSDNSVKLAAGVTVKPVKGLTLRAYYDYLNDSIDQQTFSFFSSYTIASYTIGGELTYQEGNKVKSDHDFYGTSLFAHGKITNKMNGVLRYDYVYSVGARDIEGKLWNFESDGQLFLAGVEFSPVKGVKITPNYRGWAPRNPDIKFIHSVFLNLELKL